MAPGPFSPGWSGAGPTTILQRGPTITLQRGPTTIRAVPTFLMDMVLTVWAGLGHRGQAGSSGILGWSVGAARPLVACALRLRFALCFKRKALSVR